MNQSALLQMQKRQALSFNPSGRLAHSQRACACGQHTGGGECAECRKKQAGALQRAAAGPAANVAPPIVQDVLRAPGQPLDTATRAFMEPRFGHDFSRVRVHADAHAAESAGAVKALAYTVGRDVVFDSGRYAPATADGRRLLAHELTHVVQQSQLDDRTTRESIRVGAAADPFEREAEAISQAALAGTPTGRASRTTQGPLLSRLGLGEWFDRFTGGGTFGVEELLGYLRSLDLNDQLEDNFDSDNKAREVVRLWKGGDQRFVLPVRRKVLLIQEMLSGFTGDDDEQAILDLLRGSKDAEVAIILATVGTTELKDNFHGDEFEQLSQFLATWEQQHSAAQTGEGAPPGPAAAGRIITEIIVDQATTQTVTIHWNQGPPETDICSTGKGHCCVEGATGAACTEAGSHVGGSNCTSIGRHKVVKKMPRTPSGVELWTEFNDPRDIALHEYAPVDGTPLSHGCVRLRRETAQKIFDGAVIGRTVVIVQGLARPRCDYPPLQREWAGDFREAGTSPPDGETIEARQARGQIARTRRTLRESLAVGDAELTGTIDDLRTRTGGLPTDVFSSPEARARTLAAVAPIADVIPRCDPAVEER